MTPCSVIEILTPKKFLLTGLWYGPQKAKRAFIFIHGLTASAFSGRHIAEVLVDDETAFVTFNNRGYAIVSNVRQEIVTETKYVLAGSGLEIFTDCVDDIEGAIRRVRQEGVKETYLVGSSTGCQKAVYYAHKTGDKGIKGLVLLAPLSDWAGERKKPQLRKAVALAKRMVKAGKGDELLPAGAWYQIMSAQRLLSLCTPDSVEEIFSYAQPEKKPKIYQSVKLPVLTLFAGEDEYSERPAEKLVEWFAKNTKSRRFHADIVRGVGHSFKGGEPQVAHAIRKWISA